MSPAAILTATKARHMGHKYKDAIVSPSASLVLENISFVYPSMSMIVIGHSLLY
jgi:hypothetical protein